MPTFAAKVNSVDLASIDVIVHHADGPWSFPAASYEELQIPGRPGATRSSTVATIGARDLTLSCSAQAATPEALSAIVDSLDALVTGDVTITMGHTPTRRWSGATFAGSLDGVGRDPQFVNGKVAADFELKFRLLDPYAEDITATTVSGAAATPITCPLGTRASLPVITLTGATNPVVTVKGPLGDTRGTFTLSGTGDFEIDCDAIGITLGGVDTPDAMTDGDFVELACQSGEYTAGTFPTIETTSGAISVTYRKKWAH